MHGYVTCSCVSHLFVYPLEAEFQATKSRLSTAIGGANDFCAAATALKFMPYFFTGFLSAI